METVSLLKVDTYQDNLQVKLKILLEPIGGLGSFCQRGDRVLLKPNLVLPRSPESAATTHPSLIMALVGLLSDLGCKVAVGDSPGLGSALNVIRKLGLLETLQKYQVEIIELDTPAPVMSEPSLPFERRFRNLQLAAELNDYDRVINLPKFKSHGLVGLTLAIKNLYGCIPGPAKGQWHFTAGKDMLIFSRLLLEIAYTVSPVLHILDGIIGMDGNGPSNGRPRQLGVLAVSTNPLALDRIAAELVGKSIHHLPIFQIARELGLQGMDLENIQIKGDDINRFNIQDFEIPSFFSVGSGYKKILLRLLEVLIKQKLVLESEICTVCRQCIEHCPAQAIEYHNQIKIDEKKCIKCCCCQELCPVGALKVSDPWLVRWLRKLR